MRRLYAPAGAACYGDAILGTYIVSMDDAYTHKGHEVSLWTDKHDSGWVWHYKIDGKGLRRCIKPLPLEELALEEGAVAARHEIDAAEV